MWFYDEILSNMISNRITDTKAELESAKKRHLNLMQKCEQLEIEKSNLYEKLNESELELLTKKNDLNNLLEKLKLQKIETMNLGQHLEISNMHLQMLQAQVDKMNDLNNDSLSELKPIREKLSFKWDVEDCLQKMLVGTRLDTAEQDALVADLKLREKELNSEINTLKNIKPASVSMWQEEFLDARLKEADVILEFDKIKRKIAQIKQEIEERKMETVQMMGVDDILIINIKDKYQEYIKHQDDISLANTIELQNELDRLKMEIKTLRKMKEDNNRQMHFNEETKVHLSEVRSSIYQRLQKTILNLETQINKNEKFEENMDRELSRIYENVERKFNETTKLTEKIQELRYSNEKLSASREESLNISNENLVKDLQEEITKLEERIKQFNKDSLIVEDKVL